MKSAIIFVVLGVFLAFTNAEIHGKNIHRMKRQIYESIGGYPHQTVTTYGNHQSSVSSTGTVVGTPGYIGNGFGGGLVGSGLGGGSVVGTPIHVSSINEPIVSNYGGGVSNFGGGIVGDPYGSVISPYGNVVKKTVVTETFVNRG